MITTNTNGDVWTYENGWYHQIRNGREVSKLSLKNFPNPTDIWENKVKRSEKLVHRILTLEEKNSLRPGQYIFDIWEHKTHQEDA